MKKDRFRTDRQVAHLKPLGGKRVDYHHESESGLILRVSPKSKVWMVDHMVKDGGRSKRRKKTIGKYPAVPLKRALAEARAIKANAEKGIDIVGELHARKKEPSVADLMNFYFSTKTMAKVSRIEGQRIYSKDIEPELGILKATDLRRTDVKGLHSMICERGSSMMANRTIELMRRAYNYADEEELIDLNPFPKIKNIKSPEKVRERILKDSEIRTIWRSLESETPNSRDIMRLLLLVGQRTIETVSMAIEDIEEANRLWTVPSEKTKTGKPNLLPLPPLAWSIIEPRLNNPKWLFPSKYNTTRKGAKRKGHTKSTKSVRRRLQKTTGVVGWTSHDLRRTCRTIMAREGVPSHIAEQVLGHSQPGIVAIYDQYSYLDEKRNALERVEKAIARILGGEV